MNGPFAIVIGHTGEMVGLTDRIRLRPLLAAVSGSLMFLSSEESAIYRVSPNLDETWTPLGGQPVIGRLYPEAAQAESRRAKVTLPWLATESAAPGVAAPGVAAPQPAAARQAAAR